MPPRPVSRALARRDVARRRATHLGRGALGPLGPLARLRLGLGPGEEAVRARLRPRRVEGVAGRRCRPAKRAAGHRVLRGEREKPAGGRGARAPTGTHRRRRAAVGRREEGQRADGRRTAAHGSSRRGASAVMRGEEGRWRESRAATTTTATTTTDTDVAARRRFLDCSWFLDVFR